MSHSRRTERMASLVRNEMARILIEDTSDPRLKDLVITEVEVTGDLREARVFYSYQSDIPEKVEKEALVGLKAAAPFFRKRLGECLELRHVPHLRFERDRHNRDLTRLMSLMDEIHG